MSSEARICPVCGLLVSPEAKFCSQCGTRVDGAGAAGEVRSSRRMFGVLAPGPILVLACLLLAAGIAVLVAGSPIAAIVLLSLAGASFVLFSGAIARDPSHPVAQRTLTSGHRARGWASFASRSVAAWIATVREVAKLTRESRSLRRERKHLVFALGDAAYREDAGSAESLRARLHEIDEALRAREHAREASVATARAQVHEEHVAAQPTQRFSVRDLTSGGDR